MLQWFVFSIYFYSYLLLLPLFRIVLLCVVVCPFLLCAPTAEKFITLLHSVQFLFFEQKA